MILAAFFMEAQPLPATFLEIVLDIHADDCPNPCKAEDHRANDRPIPQATKIIKLLPGDAGRPITDLASDLCYPELAEDGRAVLRSLIPIEKPVACNDGRWFTVRVMPYRTLDDRIDGLVITFADITASKELEAKQDVQHASLEKRFAAQTARMERKGR